MKNDHAHYKKLATNTNHICSWSKIATQEYFLTGHGVMLPVTKGLLWFHLIIKTIKFPRKEPHIKGVSLMKLSDEFLIDISKLQYYFVIICTGIFNDRKKKMFSQSILKKLSLGPCLGLILFLKHVQPIGTLFTLWTEHRSHPTGKNEKKVWYCAYLKFVTTAWSWLKSIMTQNLQMKLTWNNF